MLFSSRPGNWYSPANHVPGTRPARGILKGENSGITSVPGLHPRPVHAILL